MLLLSVSEPLPRRMPPPAPVKAELPERVLLSTLNVPAPEMPPPRPLMAELLEKVLLLTVSVRWLRCRRRPPWRCC